MFLSDFFFYVRVKASGLWVRSMHFEPIMTTGNIENNHILDVVSVI